MKKLRNLNWLAKRVEQDKNGVVVEIYSESGFWSWLYYSVWHWYLKNLLK